MNSSRITVRRWLSNNGYHETVKKIDEIENKWKETGKHTRRNWWDILSGGKNGKPCIIYGYEFPVLQVAQIRQGKPLTKNAIKINDKETAPPILYTGRWNKN